MPENTTARAIITRIQQSANADPWSALIALADLIDGNEPETTADADEGN